MNQPASEGLKRRKNRSAYEIGAEIVATLLHGRRTWKQVEEQVGLMGLTSTRWKRELRASGVLRIGDYLPPGGGRRGDFIKLYELQAPFAREDVPKPVAAYLLRKGGVRVAK